MPQYAWSDCPQPVRDEVLGFVEGLEQLLSDSILGVYLHGSLASGGFNPVCSDVDILILLEGSTSPTEKQALAQLALRFSDHPAPLEFSTVRQTHIVPWQYPPPFDFHFSEAHRHRIEHELRSGEWNQWNAHQAFDSDLAAHITAIRHDGITLFGLPPGTALPAVPQSDFRASILADLEWACTHGKINPLYAILNLCRILMYAQDGSNGSKLEGGRWALSHLSEDHRPIVQSALTAYATDGKVGISDDAFFAFVSFVSSAIRQQQD